MDKETIAQRLSHLPKATLVSAAQPGIPFRLCCTLQTTLLPSLGAPIPKADRTSVWGGWWRTSHTATTRASPQSSGWAESTEATKVSRPWHIKGTAVRILCLVSWDVHPTSVLQLLPDDSMLLLSVSMNINPQVQRQSQGLWYMVRLWNTGWQKVDKTSHTAHILTYCILGVNEKSKSYPDWVFLCTHPVLGSA